MALIKKPTRPRRGDSLKELWIHVDRLVDIIEAQAVEIAALKARLARRRPLDGNVIYVKCCPSEGDPVYLPVLTAGQPYTLPAETPAALVPIEEAVPDGEYVLE